MQRIFKSNLFFLIILASLVFIVYGKSINYELTGLDDDALTSKKSLYISDIKNFPKFFLTDCYHNKKITQYYRPVLSLSFAIETILFSVNTKVYHITNIILFILALYLMYLFLCKLGQNKTILKFIILVFCVHPIFVSTVVWLPARNDTLLAVFVFLFLINYVNYVKENKLMYFLLSVIFFVFSLFTKETTVIIFPIAALITYCFNLKISKKNVLNYSIVVIPILVVYFFLRRVAVAPINLNHYVTFAYDYFFNVIYGSMLYIKYTVVCHNVPILLNDLQFDVISFCISTICMFSLLLICFCKLIDTKIIIFSLICFVLFLLPTFAQEYYIWLPHRLINPLFAIIIILTALVDKLTLKYDVLKKYIVSIFLVLIFTFCFSSYMQADKYKTSKVYWMRAYINAPTYFLTMDKLADSYVESKEYQKAKDIVLKILETNKSVEYYLKLADIFYFIDNDLDLAEENYLKCLDKPISLFSKANTLFRLSKIYYLKGELNKAIEYVEKSIELLPYNKEALLYLANYYALNKQFLKARPIYEKLLKDDKNNEYYKYLIKTLDEDERENKIS